MKTRATDDHPVRRIRGVLGDADDSGFDLLLDDGATEHFAYDDVAQARTRVRVGRAAEAREVEEVQLQRANSPRANSKREPVTP